MRQGVFRCVQNFVDRIRQSFILVGIWLPDTSPPIEEYVTDCPMATFLPLPTLLSQSLVAFTIEFDNEAERRHPALHHATWSGQKYAAETVAGLHGDVPQLFRCTCFFPAQRHCSSDAPSIDKLVRLLSRELAFVGR